MNHRRRFSNNDRKRIVSFTMSSWTHTFSSPSQGLNGISGYAVLDGLGLRLGNVSGWVKDPDGRIRMLKLAVSEWFETKEYLVPVGSITLVDDERSQIHLRELTKRSLPKYCMEIEDELPEPRLLKSLIRFFPNPRPSIVERLEKPEEVPPPLSSRLTVRDDQGDGAARFASPAYTHALSWTRLDHLAPPVWTRLCHRFSEVRGHF